MARLFRQYNPSILVPTFLGVRLVGVAEGSFITVDRDEDAVMAIVGAGGDVTRVLNQNRMGVITITLMAASPSNEFLAANAVIDETVGTGYGTIDITDLNVGSAIADSPIAWVRKMPTIDRAKESPGNSVWAFHCAELNIFPAGFLPVI